MEDIDDKKISIEDIGRSNFRDLFFKYLSHWTLFLILTIICLFVSYIYLRYTVPLYEAKATVMIKNNQKGGSGMSETSAFEDLSIFNDGNSVENERSVFLSRRLMKKVVRKLDLQKEYFAIGNVTGFTKREIYDKSPILIEFNVGDSLLKNVNVKYLVNVTDTGMVQMEDGNGKIIKRIPFNKWILFNKKGVKYRILKASNFSSKLVERKYQINVVPLDVAVNKNLSKLSVEQFGNASTMLRINLQNQSKEKAVDIINQLIDEYNKDAINDKNLISKNTSDFISGRIDVISDELGNVEDSAKKYKDYNSLVDIEFEAKTNISGNLDLRRSIVQANTELELSNMMLDHIKQNDGPNDLIPINLGLADNSIERTIERHNNLVLERIEELKTTTLKNPIVVNLTNRIVELKLNINNSINNLINSNNKKLSELEEEEKRVFVNLSKTPKNEKEFRSIIRQQEIKESLYLYLLQKREETQIALAVGVGNAKVVDPAFSSGSVISPKKSFIYFGAISLAIALSILYIYVKELLYDKVYSKSDIEKKKLPYIGNIPLGEKNTQIVVTKGSKTAISEAFRSLRTNVDFILGPTTDKGKFIFITSTVAREGKSFTTVNFSLSLALSGKKVLVLGMDLRAPKLEEYLETDRSKGVTNFIVDESMTLDEIIYTSDINDNVDLLPSGDIPPNPSELLMMDRVDYMFDELGKRYDYIVVDTAPVGIVTDTLLISKFADSVIYVVRAHQLPRRMLNISSELHQEKRLPNMAILLNGTYGGKGYGYGYGYGGYGYGYGYGGYGYVQGYYQEEEKKQPWWKFWKK